MSCGSSELHLDYYRTAMSVAIDQCERHILKGEDVPADEKILSIFGQHTYIIQRSKTQSPTQFGHNVFFPLALFFIV